jgi:hypothetical protein
MVGTKVTNVCSPFGISSKELFFNIRYDGHVANYVSKSIGILDLNGGEGLLNVEGSPVIQDGQICGIRLPNFHNRKFATSFSFFYPLCLGLEKPELLKSTEPNQFPFIVKVKT